MLCMIGLKVTLVAILFRSWCCATLLTLQLGVPEGAGYLRRREQRVRGVKCRPLSLYSCGFRDSELVKPEMSSYIQRRQTGLSQLHVCCSLEARQMPRCIMVWIRLHKEGFPRTLYLLLVMNANQSLVQSHHDKKACIC